MSPASTLFQAGDCPALRVSRASLRKLEQLLKFHAVPQVTLCERSELYVPNNHALNIIQYLNCPLYESQLVLQVWIGAASTLDQCFAKSIAIPKPPYL
jgi:hypothetical protein